LYCICHFEILDYSFNEFVIIYSLYFVFNYLFVGRIENLKKET